MRSRIICFVVLLFGSFSNARVFDFKTANVGAYLRGAFGFNKVQRTPYSESFPTSIHFSDGSLVSTHYSADFGIVFSPSTRFALRLGVEILNATSSKSNSGLNAFDQALLTVDNEVSSVIPQAALDIYYKTWGSTARLYTGFGGGYAYTTIKNTVEVSTAGQSVVNSASYVEEGTAKNITFEGYTGIEAHFSDSMTFNLEFGYRSLTASDFASTRATTTPVKTYAVGDNLVNYDGTSRAVQLSGPFTAAMFRFYF